MDKKFARQELLKMVDALTMLLGSEVIAAEMKVTPRQTDIVDAIKSVKFLLDVYYRPENS